MAVTTAPAAASAPMTKEERKVIVASSAGTVFEWYDFYLAGSLAANIAATFVPGTNDTAKFIFVLFGFAAGFAVRPFGAIFFGRLGDLIGRKYTFLITMVIMGHRDLRGRHPARLRDHRLPCSHCLHHLPPAAGPRARWRIWWCCDLRGGTCAPRPPRLLHLLDPDHRNGRPVPFAAGDPVAAPVHVSGSLCGLGLARSVPAVHHPARLLHLDSSPAPGVPGLPEDEGRGHPLQGAPQGSLWPVVECQGSLSSRCSAAPPVRLWCGIRGSSTPCSS